MKRTMNAVQEYPKGKQISIDLGYYNGQRIRHIEKVKTIAEDRELRKFFESSKIREEAYKKMLIKKGYVQVEEQKQVEQKLFSDYAVEAVTKICDERIKEGKMKAVTKIGHISDTRYVSNYFRKHNDITVCKVNAEIINKFLEEFAQTHMKATVEKAVRVLRWTFEQAVTDKIIERDIMRYEKITVPYGKCKKKPPCKTGKVEIYTDSELTELHKLLKDNIYLYTFMLLLEKSGIRLSEALALKVEDIDFTGKQLLIYKAFSVCEKKGNTEKVAIKRDTTLDTTKGKESRKIDIPQVLCDQLKEYVLFTDGNKAIKKARDKNGFVFLTEDGNKQTVEGLRGRYRRLLEKEGSKIKFSFHKFRHLYGTKCIEDGMDPSLLQYYMGHKDIKITYEYYVTVTNKMRKTGSAIIEKW